MARTVKKNVRYDSHRVRLRTGETEKKYGYEYRWTTPDGVRHSTFAPTLDKLRELEEELAADKHDGIKTDVKGLKNSSEASKTVHLRTIFTIMRCSSSLHLVKRKWFR